KELLDIYLHLRAEHHPVTGRILLKDLQDALFHPFITKSDARAGIAQMVTDGPGIHRLLEKRDTSLIPQALAEQDGRVNRTGQHGTRNKLGYIIFRNKFFRLNLQVHLKTCITGLQQGRIKLHEQLVHPLDAQIKVAAAQLFYSPAECFITLERGHIFQIHVDLPDGRQYARQQYFASHLLADRTNPVNLLLKVLFHLRERVARKFERLQVDFQVKFSKFSREALSSITLQLI